MVASLVVLLGSRSIRYWLQTKDVGDIMVIVVRYFGGIKLGAGGLVRAYSHATQLAIEALALTERQFLKEISIQGDFAMEQALRHWLLGAEGEFLAADYGAAHVVFTVAVQESTMQELTEWLAAQNGKIIVCREQIVSGE